MATTGTTTATNGTSTTTTIKFTNPEFQADGSFETHDYMFEGSQQDGWQIHRDGKPFYQLGSGYTPVTTKFCGVCSTDLARQFLPFPLPQITGHEVVGYTKSGNGDNDKQEMVVIEINASEYARKLVQDEGETKTNSNPYVGSMHTHDPTRIVLGINRLPGGFSPVLLAPVGAIIPVPASINAETAALTEPFAAALQGIEATLPQPGDKVAVLGPRRLGSLIIAALAGVRHSRNLQFEISAIVRHEPLGELAKQLGADHVVNTTKLTNVNELDKQYDIVFDTTGKQEGFTQALRLAKRVVHLKTTNGQPVEGVTYMTDLVVDEMTLLPYSLPNALQFGWPNDAIPRPNKCIFVAPGVPQTIIEDLKAKADYNVYQGPIQETYQNMIANGPLGKDLPEFLQGAAYPRFDLAVASSLAEIDEILRPETGGEISLVRARGAILLVEGSDSNNNSSSNLWKAILNDQLTIQSSRCGNFANALKILDENPTIAKAMETNLITHTLPLNDIKSAFELAADSTKSVKVLVQTDTNKTA